MSKGWRIVQNSAPQLLGFGIGLGAFAYVEKFGSHPPPAVQDSQPLLACHNALVGARAWFQDLGKQFRPDGPQAPKLQHDPNTLARECRTLYESGDTEGALQRLYELFLSQSAAQYMDMLMFHEDMPQPTEQPDEAESKPDPFDGGSPLPWLVSVVPKLWKSGALQDLEAIAMATWLSRVDPASLLQHHRDMLVDLPLRVLREGQQPEAFLAATLLIFPSSLEAAEMVSKRMKRSWLSFYTPRNAVAEQIAKEKPILQKLVGLLSSAANGADHSAFLLLQVLDSDRRHAKALSEMDVVNVTSQELIRGYSSFTPGGDSKSEAPTGDVRALPALLRLLSTMVNEGIPSKPGAAPAVKSCLETVSAEAVRPLADAVFKGFAATLDDEHSVICAIHLLSCLSGIQEGTGLPATVGFDWLVEKGVVVAAAQSLQYHPENAEVYHLVSSFLYPILNDPQAKALVSDEQHMLLSSALYQAQYPEADFGDEDDLVDLTGDATPAESPAETPTADPSTAKGA